MTRMISLLLLTLACGTAVEAADGPDDRPVAAPALAEGQAEAIFATGCFWCAESDFEKVHGVIDAVSGYAAGHTERPRYKEVGSGATGHTEALRVIYDPDEVSYEALLDHFWRTVDPFDGGGQFCDRGSQYRPALMPVGEEQQRLATASLQKLDAKLDGRIAVKVEDPGTFWVAEEYHQDFYKKNPSHYYGYRKGCGRDKRVAQVQELMGPLLGPRLAVLDEH